MDIWLIVFACVIGVIISAILDRHFRSKRRKSISHQEMSISYLSAKLENAEASCEAYRCLAEYWKEASRQHVLKAHDCETKLKARAVQDEKK